MSLDNAFFPEVLSRDTKGTVTTIPGIKWHFNTDAGNESFRDQSVVIVEPHPLMLRCL